MLLMPREDLEASYDIAHPEHKGFFLRNGLLVYYIKFWLNTPRVMQMTHLLMEDLSRGTERAWKD